MSAKQHARPRAFIGEDAAEFAVSAEDLQPRPIGFLVAHPEGPLGSHGGVPRFCELPGFASGAVADLSQKLALRGVADHAMRDLIGDDYFAIRSKGETVRPL